MLSFEDLEEGFAESSLGGCALARNRQGLAGAGSCVLLDQVFEVVVVNIIVGPFGDGTLAKRVAVFHILL